MTRRDKKSVRFLTVLETNVQVYAKRIDEGFINSMTLDNNVKLHIINVLKENRMEWEGWMESSNEFSDLRERLKNNGYKGIPIYPNFNHIDFINIPNSKNKVNVKPKEKVKKMLR